MYLHNRSRYDELEKAAVGFLEDYGIENYPLDPLKLLKQMRVPVKSYFVIPASKRALALKASQDAFHLSPTNHDIRHTCVYYVPSENTGRMRTSLFHELAHIICDHPSDGEPYESEARYLASYLQAPTPLLIALGLHYPEDVSSIFKTSLETSLYRCQHAEKRRRLGQPWSEYEQRLLSLFSEWLSHTLHSS